MRLGKLPWHPVSVMPVDRGGGGQQTSKMEAPGVQGLNALLRAINALNRFVGRVFAWLALGIVLVCFWVVVERYLFSTTRLWMQDLYVWLNGAMFTAVAGFALLREQHVRVDVFYRTASNRSKAWSDLVGTVFFLLPFVVVVFIYGLPFVQRSWRFMEGSANVGGMPGLYILKTFILVFVVLLGLQAVAMLVRSIMVLAGRDDMVPDDYKYGTLE
ncbi:TRAP transporter small permease subunit [Roseovarius amoyensis]|uniref:TRAP transporter small permease subunit n=1 Tax=Roseovarius amoyensis TaxID=2211448 RepID=UPI00308405C0